MGKKVEYDEWEYNKWEHDFIKLLITILVIIVILGSIFVIYVESINPDFNKSIHQGYLYKKQIELLEFSGKYVPNNTYGTYHILYYVEDKTGLIYKIKVDKEIYDKAIISTSNLVKFKN